MKLIAAREDSEAGTRIQYVANWDLSPPFRTLAFPSGLRMVAGRTDKAPNGRALGWARSREPLGTLILVAVS